MANYIVSSGETSSGSIQHNDSMTVLNGGTASSTTVNYGGVMNVSSGGRADSTDDYGSMFVSSGGTANETTVYTGANMTVAGTANSTTLLIQGHLSVASGGTVNSTTVGQYATMYVVGNANDTTVSHEGNMYVAGTANGVITSGGTIGISSGTATNINLVGVYIYYGISSEEHKGLLTVFFGGTANSVTVNSRGVMQVSSGGTATEIIVKNGGSAVVSSGGTTDNTTVCVGGSFTVSSGGTGTNIIVSDGAWLHLTVASNTYVQGTSGGSAFEVKDALLSGFSLNNGNEIIVEGGTANSTTVNGGRLHVSSGGTANDVIIHDAGRENGAYVYSGGEVNGVSIDNGGNLYISNGATVRGIIENGGRIDVADNATATFVANTFSNVVVTPYNDATIHSGTTAINTTMEGGWLWIYDGGVMNGAVIHSGVIYVSSGGAANHVSFSDIGGSNALNVYDGGTANDVSICSGGSMFVSSGGTATAIIENGGFVDIEDGASIKFASNVFSGLVLSSTATVHSGTTANRTELNSGGNMHVFSGGFASRTTIFESGNLFVSSGGLAVKTSINAGGQVSVLSGGTGQNNTVNASGSMTVSSGGTADSASIIAGGTMKILSGGTLTGSVSVDRGSLVFVERGSILNFDLTLTAPDGKALLNDWSLLQGTPNCTLTFSSTLANGVYLLAENAEDFEETITVVNTSNESLGMLEVGKTIIVGNKEYTLNLNDDVLSVTVSGSMGDAVAPTITNVKADITTPTNGSVTVTATFADDYGLAQSLYRIGETGNWLPYVDGVTVSENTTVYFKAIDIAGNKSEIARYAVTNIKTDPVVSSGIIVSSGQSVIVSSGFIHEKTTVLSGGSYIISSGGVTNNTIINSGGWLEVYSGGTATNVVWTPCEGHVHNDGGYVTFTSQYSGVYCGAEDHLFFQTAMISSTTIAASGEVYVMSGGAVNSTTFNSSFLCVFSGGTANDLVFNVGQFVVSSGGSVGNIVLNDSPEPYIKDSPLCFRGGRSFVNKGGTANNVTVNSRGRFVIDGGSADNVTINSGGEFEIWQGGSATNVAWTPCEGGQIEVEGDAYITFASAVSGVYYGSNGHLLSRADVMETKTVFAGGEMIVMSDGIAKSNTVCSGKLSVWMGTAADTIGSSAYINVYQGGKVINTTLFDGSTLYNRNFNGSADNTTVDTLGWFRNCGVANSTMVKSGGSMTVYSGGIANTTTVKSGGSMVVYSGGKLTGQTAIAGEAAVSIESGAILDFDISELKPGMATRINDLSRITDWGKGDFILTVSMAQTNGTYTLAEGASRFKKVISVVNTMDKTFGILEVGEHVTVGSKEYTLNLNDDVLSVTVSGSMGDAVAPTITNVKADITTPTNGSVTVTATFADDVGLVQSLYRIGESGQWQNYVNGVNIFENTTVFFKAIDAAGNESEVARYVVSNIDKVAPSAPSELKALKDEQTVMLIWNASTDNLSGVREYIVNYTNGSQAFTVKTDNTNYMLNNLASGSWSWSVQAIDNVGNVSTTTNGKAFTVQSDGPEKPYVARGDRDGNGVSDVMFVWTGNTYAHGYWMNGSSDWWSANAPWVASDWDNLGSYDMSGDGKADAVMFGNVEVNGNKGAYIGYYQDGDDANGWVNIGYLNNTQNIAWKNKIGNLTGSASGANSIVWYAPELYALGVWKDGKEDWATLSGSFGGEAWTLVGCGDFNGDGKDSVLMSYNKGQMFYSVGLDDEAKSHGSANWSNGWEVRAIGDFAGDGKDDIVLFHKESGAMVMLIDGNTDNYAVIGQLDPGDWFIAGCGDYNADGTDDLLVRQYSTGMLGYYSNGNQANWNVMGYGVGMEWTVIA